MEHQIDKNPPNPPDFELLVFDWDGTLMDSIGSIAACTHRALEDLGLDPIEDDLIRRSVGLGLADSMARLFPDGLPVELDVLIERYRHHWFAGHRELSVLYEGARAAIEELDGRGHLLSVATGKGRAGLDRELDATGLGRYFSATRTVDEAPSKPNPQMLLDLCEELGQSPEKTLMIGDTTYDLEMAHHAGAASVAVLTGAHREEELQAWGPLTCLPTVADLPSWLDGSPPRRVLPRSSPIP